ncbi:redoxin family protein [Sphingobacterium lactis]|uniref:TlpA family protein disulfide reductase n=2 Tax=Sphingobacterium TaxID=28453 RepID=UPI003EC68B59
MLFGYAQAQSPNSGAANGLTDIKPLFVGEQLPDEFWTKEYLFYTNGDTIRKNLSEYKGKLLVLDFWATWCAICLAQMKDKEILFAKYPNETAFLMINSVRTNDTYSTIAKNQDKIAALSAEGQVKSIIEDPYMQRLFPTGSYPRYVWIGPRGNLIAVTTALSVTEGHLKDMLNLLNQSYGTK